MWLAWLRVPDHPATDATMSSDEHDRAGHAVGDARKRLLDLPNHDEVHAHADIDFTGPNVVLGED